MAIYLGNDLILDSRQNMLLDLSKNGVEIQIGNFFTQ